MSFKSKCVFGDLFLFIKYVVNLVNVIGGVEYNIKSNIIWCDYKLIWSMFDDYDYDYAKSILKKHLIDSLFFIPLDVEIYWANLCYDNFFNENNTTT